MLLWDLLTGQQTYLQYRSWLLQGGFDCLPDDCIWCSSPGDAKSATANKLAGAVFNKLHFKSRLTGTVCVSRTIGMVFPQYALTCVVTSNRSALRLFAYDGRWLQEIGPRTLEDLLSVPLATSGAIEARPEPGITSAASAATRTMLEFTKPVQNSKTSRLWRATAAMIDRHQRGLRK